MAPLPPTPRRGRPMGTRTTPRQASPPPAGPDERFQFKLPSFFLGFICAVFLLMIGVSFGPGGERIGVSPVLAEGAQDFLAEHNRLRVACGLPKIKDPNKFKCKDGKFLGENEPISNLECDFELSALRDGTGRTSRIKLMNWTDPESEQGLRSRKQGLTECNFYVRWVDDGQPSDIASFSLRDHNVEPHLADKELEKSLDRFTKRPNLRFRLLWGRVVHRNFPVWDLWVGVQHIAEDIPGIQEPYPAQLQYVCMNNEPQLALLPRNEFRFFDQAVARLGEMEGSNCGLAFDKNDLESNPFSDDVGPMKSCIDTWVMGSKDVIVKAGGVFNTPYVIAATLLGPQKSGKQVLKEEL